MKKLIILSISLLFIFTNNLYSQGIKINEESTVTFCVDTLYDSGGSSGNYSKNDNDTIIISPTNASKIFISIDSLNINTGAQFHVYDGDIGASQLYNLTGPITSPLADTISTESYITVVFISDNHTTRAGFAMAWQGHTQVTATTTDVTCNGNDDGEIDIDVSGTTPVSYEWTGPNSYSSTSQNINTLKGGDYYLTATDYNGCFVTDSFNINEESALTTNLVKTDVSCNGFNDGTIAVTPGGGTETTYSYSWEKDGAPYAPTTSTISSLAPAVYTVTVTDEGASSCTIVDSAVITEPSALTLDFTKTDVSCNGGNDGTITANANGGTGPYTYSWEKYNDPYAPTTATITGLDSAIYTVTVTDVNSCTIIGDTTVTEPPALTLDFTKTDVNCNGGNDGSVTANANGGTGSYTYLWKRDKDTGFSETTVTVSALYADNYHVTVTDDNFCTITGDTTITEPPALTTNLVKTDVSCNGFNDGTIAVNPGGGTTTYSYQWEKNGSAFTPTMIDDTIKNLVPADYKVTVTDVNSCTIIDSATITEPPAIALFNVTGTGSYCTGYSVTVGLDDSETGVNYQLLKDGSNEGASVAGTDSPLSWDSQTQGTYTVEATNVSTSCTKTMTNSAVVTENPLPTAYNVTGTNSYCAGSSGVTVDLSNSQTGVTYQLLKDGSNDGSHLAGTGSSLSWNNKTEGTYTIEATDTTKATSCTQTMYGSAVVTENPLPTSYNVTGTGSYCEGSSVTVGLDGSEIGVKYILLKNSVKIDSTAGTGSPLLWNNKKYGTYTVEATDTTKATLCTQTMSDSAVVTENPLPTVNVINLLSTYNYTDDPVVLTGSPSEGTFSGPGITTSDDTFHPNLADTVSPNQILYSYTDGNGCTNIDTNMVDVVTSGGKIDSLKAIYCYADHDYKIFGTNPNDSIGSFEISGGVGLLDSNNNTAYINPSLIGPGTDTITYTYSDGIEFNVVRTFTVDSVGYVDFDMNIQYCEGDDVVMLTPADTAQGVGFYPSGGQGTWDGALTPFLTPNIINGNTAQLDPTYVDFDSTYNISFYYTSPNGCKSNTVTKSVTVNSKPNVSFTLLNYYNYEGEAVTLQGKVDGIVTPGSFNGPGITNDSIFNPDYAGIGDNKIINYEYTNPTTGCSNNVNDTTNIRAANDTIINLADIYCYKDTSFLISCSPINFSDTIGTFTSYRNAIVDTNLYDNKAVYSLVTAGNGRDTVTYTYYFGTTRFDVQKVVTIDSIGNVDFSLDTSYCVSAGSVNLAAIYSHSYGTGNFTNTITGLYNYGNTAYLDLDEITPDSDYVINYTYTSNISGCQSFVEKGVRINANPVVSFDLLNNYNVNSDPVDLISIVNSDTTLDGTFSGPGITGGEHIFSPELAGVQSDAIISYTYEDTITGCSSSISHSTNIISAKASISGANDNNIYCYYEAVDTLYGTNIDGVPNSGYFTGKGITNLSTDTATYDPVLAGSGNDTIRYIYISAADTTMELSVEKILNVDLIGNVLISDLDTAYCADHERVYIKGTPEDANGSFFGEGIVDNGDGSAYFYPTLTTPDSSYTIRYIYSSPSPSICQKIYEQNVRINPLPTVSFTLKDNYNKVGDPVPLVGNHTQGTFSGLGVIDNIFYPNFISAGSQAIINYQYTDSITGCSNNVNDTTEVRIAEGYISNLSSTICYMDTVIEITGNNEGLPNFGTFTNYKGSIVDNGDSTASYNVVNAGSGNDTVIFTYFRNETKYEIVQPVIIDSIGNIDFITLDSTYCFGDHLISLQATFYYPGSGNFSTEDSVVGFANYGNSATLDPSLIPTGSYNVKYVFTSSVGDGVCKDSISKPVTFYPLPDVSFNMRDIYNIDEAKDSLIASPSGDIFSGTGVSGNYFLPDQAGLGSEFIITYSYTDNHNCFNSVSDTTSVKEASGSISSDDVYCYNDNADTLVAYPNEGLPGGFFIGDGIENIAPNTAKFTPSQAGSDEHFIEFQYEMKGDNDTAVFYLYKTISVDSIADVDFTNLKSSYCQDDESEELIGSPSNGSFSGPGIIDNGDGTAFFSPNNANIGQNTIRYKYTNINTGCWLDKNKIVTINQVPDIDFTINDACIADSIRFTFISALLDSIEFTSWSFGDGSDDDNRLNPNHLYTIDGEHTIKLTASTYAGCSNSMDSTINFGVPPVADFSWKNVCFAGDSVKFFNNTQGLTNNYYWDFGDNNHSSDKNPKHSYNAIGDFDVKLIVTTDNSCNDTILQKIHIRPYIKFDEIPSYSENFNTGKAGWYSQYRDVSNSSWQFGIPTSTLIFNSDNTDSVWCTNLSGNYNDNERSVISSPCFDFTALERPMIKMKVFSNSQMNYDGTVLQYSLNDSNWVNIGTIGDGIKWFNTSGIASNPGDQTLYQEGWSGNNDSTWFEVRHDIDNLKNQKNVRFRIAFASDASNSDYEGFAFDDIWIGERSRKVLLEHFTNSSSTNCNTINSQVNSIVKSHASDVVDVQYHTSFPGEDPMNVYNPAAPSARLMYYGISNVPYSIVDGKLNYDYSPSSLTENSIRLRALESPKFNIELNTEKSTNTVNITAKIIALDTLENQNISLYLAVVEKEIEIQDDVIKYQSVLRKMLPNAGGINYSQNWLPGSNKIVNQSWQVDNDVNIDNVNVIAFVQNENSKQIYQAATDDTTTSSTGINSFFADNNDFNFLIYPNPSVNETYVLFNKPLDNNIYLQIFNQIGLVVKSVKIDKGKEMFVFNTSSYPEGMYFVRINDKKFSTTKKFVVIK